jgi:hypothetical protein
LRSCVGQQVVLRPAGRLFPAADEPLPIFTIRRTIGRSIASIFGKPQNSEQVKSGTALTMVRAAGSSAPHYL